MAKRPKNTSDERKLDRYPGIRILDDKAVYLDTETGDIRSYGDSAADGAVLETRPLLVLDTLTDEYTNPAKIAALKALYRRAFSESRTIDFSISHQPDMGTGFDEQVQKRLRMMPLSQTIYAYHETCEAYLNAATEAEKHALLENVYDQHMARVSEKLLEDGQGDSVEQRIAIKARTASGPAPRDADVQILTRQMNRDALEKEVDVLPKEYLELLHQARINIFAMSGNTGSVGDIDSAAGMSLHQAGHILIYDAFSRSQTQNASKTSALKIVFEEEVVHTLDALMNFSTRDSWSSAMEKNIWAKAEGASATRQILTHFCQTIGKSNNYITNQIGLREGVDTPAEVLVDIAAFAKHGRNVMRQIADVGKGTQLAEKVKEVKYDPEAFLKKFAPDIWSQYVEFEKEIKTSAKTAEAERKAEHKAQTSAVTREASRKTGDDEGHGGV